MTWDEVLAYCLAKPGAWQDEPWEGDVVAKVGPRIFAFLGRSGWNTLQVGGKIPDEEITEAIDASYAAVVAKLPKKDRPAEFSG
jgi:predicted DNA-binding protein (MmcQ/YjbR family)